MKPSRVSPGYAVTNHSRILIAVGASALAIVGGCAREVTQPGNARPGANLLDGSFDSLTYTAPISLSYVAKDGSSITDSVLPGQVVVLVDPAASRTQIEQLFTGNGAKISAQIPNAGLYTVSLNESDVSSFLSAMYQSNLVLNAFPNSVLRARGKGRAAGASPSVVGDGGSLIQTIDDAEPLGGGCGSLTHEDAVLLIASQGGVGAHFNDVSAVFPDGSIGTTPQLISKKLLGLVANATSNNTPVIINISLGYRGVYDNLDNNRFFYADIAQLLATESLKYPGILNNVLVLVAGADKPINETNSFEIIEANFLNPGIGDNLDFVESQEGFAGCGGGIGLGYVDPGTRNVFTAQACNVHVTPTCVVSGTSFATPAIANLIALSYIARQKDLSLSDIAAALWAFELQYQRLPTGPSELLAYANAYVAIASASCSTVSPGVDQSVLTGTAGGFVGVSIASGGDLDEVSPPPVLTCDGWTRVDSNSCYRASGQPQKLTWTRQKTYNGLGPFTQTPGVSVQIHSTLLAQDTVVIQCP